MTSEELETIVRKHEMQRLELNDRINKGGVKIIETTKWLLTFGQSSC